MFPRLLLVIVLLCVVLPVAAFGADPNSSPLSAEQLSMDVARSVHRAPWFNGTNEANSTASDSSSTYHYRTRQTLRLRPGTADASTCLKMRTYQVKRLERFAEGESSLRGYSTCQLATNFQVRTAIGEHVLEIAPR